MMSDDRKTASLWTARREFGFFRHVAFDQPVALRIAHFRKETAQGGLAGRACVGPGRIYVKMPDGNLREFAGPVACAS